MRLRFNFGRSLQNYHGKDGEAVRSAFRVVDLLQPILRTGNKTRARWYKRFIVYFPSGAWWHMDVAIVRDWRAQEGKVGR